MQSLLCKHKSTVTTTFGSKNCVCCFAHIINICSLHIVASVTFHTKKKASSNPKPNLSADSNGASSGNSDDKPGNGNPDGDPDNELGGGDLNSDSDSNDELGDGNSNLPCADELAPPSCYDGQGKFKPKQWATAIIKHNLKILFESFILPIHTGKVFSSISVIEISMAGFPRQTGMAVLQTHSHS